MRFYVPPSPWAVTVNIVAPFSHVFRDILVQCWSGLQIIKLKHIQETAISFRVQKGEKTNIKWVNIENIQSENSDRKFKIKKDLESFSSI